MALKIVKAADPIVVSQIVLCIYAPPGVGKSSLAFTAKDPLLLDFDKGVHRAANRKDSVLISSWGDVANITAEDLAPYSTVILDTAGRALDFLGAQIIKDDAKMGRGGQLTLQGFGALKGRFATWLNSIKLLGKDVILIAHSEEKHSGDDIIERLDVQGGSKNEIYKSADAMGRIRIEAGKRQLVFSPTDTAFGKNPGQFESLDIPHPDKGPDFLAGVIADIKAKLNQQSEEMRLEQQRMESLRTDFETLETADHFTNRAKALAKAPAKDKALLMTVAETKGFVFDKKASAFALKQAAAA